MDFEGIIPPLIAPFDATGAFDRDALADLIEHLIAAGVHGVVSGGSTGEFNAQTLEERADIARFTVARVKGRAAVLVGVGAMRPADSMALARAAREAGADALLLGSPPYAVPTEAENAANALAIDRAAGLPIMLYNYPGRTGADMGPAFLDAVSVSANFRAIKESTGDIGRLHLLARSYPDIALCCGADDQALEFFAWGARSWVCAGANFLPAEHLALWRTCAVEGDFSTGRRLMAAMLPLMETLEQGGRFVQSIKAGVEGAGLRAGPPRPPLLPLDDEARAELAATVETLRAEAAAILAQGKAGAPA